MRLTRRTFVQLSLASAIPAAARRALAQGIASHTAKPLARPAPSGRPFLARFVDVAAAAGLRAPIVYGGVEGQKYILETIGCGCAFIDYDNDGWMDIFLLSGTRLEGTPEDATNRLYRNNRDGTFTDVTAKAGLRGVGWASGVCVGDYNNDGFDDIFCTYFGQNRLYRNNGDGTFADVTAGSGLEDTGYSQGVAVGDVDGDGHDDLFVTAYGGNHLFLNNGGSGKFRDVTPSEKVKSLVSENGLPLPDDERERLVRDQAKSDRRD